MEGEIFSKIYCQVALRSQELQVHEQWSDNCTLCFFWGIKFCKKFIISEITDTNWVSRIDS